ncbi:MAG: VacJ family lipoprotein [Alphaproteobacteria bacterium]|nr:VacJ family lipoprotein [Alphaproteobacteria bacterium]
MLNKLGLCVYISAFALMTASCSSTSSHNESDGLESYNRAVYKFNNQFYKYVMKPVSKGYRHITTPTAREHIGNAFSNVKEPIYAVNHLLQGEVVESGKDLARFAVNTTLGIAGTYDVAGKGWNLPKNKTGFDDTLATWGMPDGPFIMLPFVGPSTPRATAGLVADSFANPVYWATANDANIHDKVYYPYVAANAVVVYESGMDVLDDLERNSVDFYTTMKSAYIQNRNGKASDDTVSYDFGMDDEEEDY